MVIYINGRIEIPKTADKKQNAIRKFIILDIKFLHSYRAKRSERESEISFFFFISIVHNKMNRKTTPD